MVKYKANMQLSFITKPIAFGNKYMKFLDRLVMSDGEYKDFDISYYYFVICFFNCDDVALLFIFCY